MKTIKLIVASIALLSVLSCQKEGQENVINPEYKGGQLVTCSFAANSDATRTSLGEDGLTPCWSVGDTIMLYDGVANTQKLGLAKVGEPSSEIGIIDIEDSTVFTFLRPDGWSAIYAIYPSCACAEGFSANAPKLNFAAQDGSFARANICAAASVADSMSFKNVGAILKFKSKPATVTNILIPINGLTSDYQLSFNEKEPVLGLVAASNSKCFNIGDGTDCKYIGVPSTTTLDANSEFLYRNSDLTILGLYKTAASNSIVKNKIYTLPAIDANGQTPDGMLSHVFSVSADKKVYFSKGNLKTMVDITGGLTGWWSFSDNQYDCVGNENANNSIGTSGGYVDLFGWSTDAVNNQWGVHTQTTYKADYSGGNFNDWGNKAGQWRTLTRDEWVWLLGHPMGAIPGSNCRTSSTVSGVGNARYVLVNIALDASNKICGLLIFPDAFTWPSGIEVPFYEHINSNLSGNWAKAGSYTGSQFTELQKAGCVFLPASGIRKGIQVESYNSMGAYWAATYDTIETNADRLSFNASGVTSNDNNSRCNGQAVRLVSDAQ